MTGSKSSGPNARWIHFWRLGHGRGPKLLTFQTEVPFEELKRRRESAPKRFASSERGVLCFLTRRSEGQE